MDKSWLQKKNSSFKLEKNNVLGLLFVSEPDVCAQLL